MVLVRILLMNATANKSLQRTRVCPAGGRSPLSSEPLAETGNEPYGLSRRSNPGVLVLVRRGSDARACAIG